MTDDARAAAGAGRGDARAQNGRAAEAEDDRIARGQGVQDQIDRGADVREQNRLTTPERAAPERRSGPG